MSCFLCVFYQVLAAQLEYKEAVRVMKEALALEPANKVSNQCSKFFIPHWRFLSSGAWFKVWRESNYKVKSEKTSLCPRHSFCSAPGILLYVLQSSRKIIVTNVTCSHETWTKLPEHLRRYSPVNIKQINRKQRKF